MGAHQGHPASTAAAGPGPGGEEAGAAVISESWGFSPASGCWQSRKGPCCLFPGAQRGRPAPRGARGARVPRGCWAAWAGSGTAAGSPGPGTAASAGHCSARRAAGASGTGTRCSRPGGSPPRKRSPRARTEAAEKTDNRELGTGRGARRRGHPSSLALHQPCVRVWLQAIT